MKYFSYHKNMRTVVETIGLVYPYLKYLKYTTQINVLMKKRYIRYLNLLVLNETTSK